MPFDVTTQFQQLKFKGIELVTKTAGFGSQLSVAEHSYIFKDDPRLQPTGRGTADTYRYELVFSEMIEPEHFTTKYYEMLAAYRENTPGELVTLVHGTINALCVKFEREIVPSMKDGIIVNAEFLYSPPDEDEKPSASPALAPLRQTAKRATDLVSQVPGLDDEDYESLVNPLDALNGLADQILDQIDRTKAILDAQIFRIQRLIDKINLLTDPKNWNAIAALQNLELAYHTAKQGLGTINGKVILYGVVDFPMTLVAAAKYFGTSTEILLKLNREETKPIVIPRDTVLRYTAK